MRAVLTGTDFVKDTDGSFKAIETNTNIFTNADVGVYLDSSILNNFIFDNNINEIVFISKEKIDNVGFDIDLTPGINENSLSNFYQFLKKYCEKNNINFSFIKVDNNSSTIPVVEDSDNKLIIRGCYDTTAIIDDTYARDNWEFLKLLHDADPNSIPKTYINHSLLGFDSIGTDIRDNSGNPNFLIKKRYTPADNHVYPILYNITTIDELNSIKNNLLSDEYLQEYIYNPNDTLDDRLIHYRSVDLIYGNNLNALNLWCIQVSNTFSLNGTCDLDDNGVVQYWDRPKYISKHTNFGEKAPKLSADQYTKVLDTNNELKYASSLQTGDTVKSIVIPDLPEDVSNFNPLSFAISETNLLTNYQISSTSLKQQMSNPLWDGIIVNFTTQDGISFSDVDQAIILTKGKVNKWPVPVSGSNEDVTINDSLMYGIPQNELITFTSYNKLEVGDTVILFNSETSQLEEHTIGEIFYTFERLSVYVLDFGEFDTFLTMEENNPNPKYGIITHNYNYDCYHYSTNVWYRKMRCYSCWYGGWTGLSTDVCCRCGNWLYGSCANQWGNVQCACYWGGWADCTCNPGVWSFNQGYCNDQKNPSDIFYKENINYLYTNDNGLKIYSYNYKNNNDIYEGVIAQDLIGTKFERALSRDSIGKFNVNYSMLNLKLKKIN